MNDYPYGEKLLLHTRHKMNPRQIKHINMKSKAAIFQKKKKAPENNFIIFMKGKFLKTLKNAAHSGKYLYIGIFQI